jgi:predicted ABC-type transport system involved in lysophospholipase L1 biosynthesis ATPase subunit
MYSLFPRLAQQRRQLAGSLSGGEQQMCAIARGLMAQPRLMMVDEMSLGLAPAIIEKLMDVLLEIPRAGRHGSARRAGCQSRFVRSRSWLRIANGRHCAFGVSNRPR